MPEGKSSLQTPGPGSHTKSYSSFQTTNKVNFGIGRKETRNDNPGPGQYNNKNTEIMVKSASVRIGSQARPDIWESKKEDMPGPGNYVQDINTFGKSVKGAAGMGSKYKPDVN